NSPDDIKHAQAIKKRKHARDKVLQALYQWQLSGEDLDWIRDHYVQEQGVSSGDEAYFIELLYKIPSQVSQLDEQFKKYVSKFEDHVDPIEINILRIATYEFQHHLEIPFKVVINEAVKLAKTYGADDSHKFINGVLDPLSKQLRELETKAASD
ncbi:MAG: transcription antitermination factor NusB, partial [Gammaproteobacteria bacterium]|nr:transcription antitermination factor NusB [Gammaproteobacteria bacterium]